MNSISQTHNSLNSLKQEFKGEIYTNDIWRTLYATDASAYREMPVAIALPKDNDDIKALISFANEFDVPLIPRTAGTSLAGQVVGNGIIVDVSKYMRNIIELNEKENWVRVQPSVVLDELNKYLENYGLFFGPETSTSSRCMIAGMVGNNSCGAHSLVYGSTRDHTLEIKAILSDRSEAIFGSITKEKFVEKCNLQNLEGEIYRHVNAMLSDSKNQEEIINEYPDKSLKRRNTGYAIDLLLDCEPFTNGGEPFNFCKLLAGSEGTLAFITEIKLNLVPIPPKETVLVCVHLKTVEESLRANLIALKHQPVAVELMDSVIIELTKENIEQRKNRFFVQGEPGAILIVEFAKNTREEVMPLAQAMEAEMIANNLGYHFPMIFGDDIKKVWNLRKAGLGVLSNMPGDAKPVPVIEDTAVAPERLPDYIREFDILLAKHKLKCVYHAHIATGELHLRPLLNLKDPKDVELFHTIALETAKLVKKYKGSLSGEHGDGRLRGEFIPLMIGDHNYKLVTDIKKVWDSKGIFNPGKIVDTPKMNSFLRYEVGKETKEIKTIFDFSSDLGFMRAVEKCNGSGDCRKTEVIGGSMCPSYMATRNENATTRGRANILREYLLHSTKQNPFDHKEIYEIMDLCLSCKGCKSECPSSVDMTRLKAEFMQHYYDSNGIPLRSRMIAYISYINKLGMILPSVFNFFAGNKFTSSILKSILGFAPKRSIPALYKYTLRQWAKKNLKSQQLQDFPNGKVCLFVDEFTEYNDTLIGIKTIQLLNKLGYYVELPSHDESGRTFLSKGLIRTAQKLANKNVKLLKDLINKDTPLIGIEPSGILSFRDEYPDLVNKELVEASKNIAKNAFLFDEFFMREVELGKIDSSIFKGSKKKVKLHGHCHQKSLASLLPTKQMLEYTNLYSVEEIKSGCCGMAGSFGYEKEHYDVSMKVGGLVLFPEIINNKADYIISAPGTSCRHQIKDGTGVAAFHPIELMWELCK
ncbi:MAG: FAD-linked oxidase C-terminal domain-containing protein [Bacteroidota bacterium]